MANTEQARAWNGDNGRHFLTERVRHERMHQPLVSRLLDATAISAGETVVDIGCGCGATTRTAARAAAPGHALGVDLSAVLLAEARRIAERDEVTNVRFQQADAQTHPFDPGGYDVAISSLGVMFFDDPQAAFTNIGTALRPGGRLAFVCWQQATDNEFLAVPFAAIAAHLPSPELPATDQPGPFSLASPQRIHTLLSAAGFHDITLDALHEPLRIGEDIPDVLGYYRTTPLASSMLDTAEETTATAVLDTLATALRPHQGPDGVYLGSAAWLVTAHR